MSRRVAPAGDAVRTADRIAASGAGIPGDHVAKSGPNWPNLRQKKPNLTHQSKATESRLARRAPSIECGLEGRSWLPPSRAPRMLEAPTGPGVVVAHHRGWQSCPPCWLPSPPNWCVNCTNLGGGVQLMTLRILGIGRSVGR